MSIFSHLPILNKELLWQSINESFYYIISWEKHIENWKKYILYEILHVS